MPTVGVARMMGERCDFEVHEGASVGGLKRIIANSDWDTPHQIQKLISENAVLDDAAFVEDLPAGQDLILIITIDHFLQAFKDSTAF